MLCQYGETWLTGSTHGSRTRGGARNIRVADRQAVQVAEFLRAAQVSVFGRGNIETSVSFESTWTFDTDIEAAAECGKFRASLPNNADAKFIWGYGITQRALQLDSAALEVCAPDRFIGRSIVMGFTVRGGRLYEISEVTVPGLRVWNPDLNAYCILQARGIGETLTLSVLPPAGTVTGRAGGLLVFDPDISGNVLVVARGLEPEFALEISADTSNAAPNVPQAFNPDSNRYCSLIAAGDDPFTLYPVANV